MMVSMDRYVGRIVAGAWLAAAAFFLFLSVLIDLLNNVGKYVDNAEESGLSGFGLAGYLLGYYGQMLPYFFVTIGPFVTVIACMFAVARLQAANEVVPMLFAGRSTIRILRPMLVCAALSGLTMAACWQWVVPQFASTIAEAQKVLRSGERVVKGIVLEPDGEVRRRLYVGEFEPGIGEVRKVALLVQGALPGDARLVRAPRAVWDPAQRDWRLIGGSVRSGRRTDPQQWLGMPGCTPDELLRKGREDIDPDLLAYDEIGKLLQERPNRTDARLALHRHITYPLANLLLVMLALPLAIWFERGSRIERILGAIGCCGAYLLVDLTCQSLGQRELVHPIVAAWSPTILFGSLGLVMFGGVRT